MHASSYELNNEYTGKILLPGTFYSINVPLFEGYGGCGYVEHSVIIKAIDVPCLLK